MLRSFAECYPFMIIFLHNIQQFLLYDLFYKTVSFFLNIIIKHDNIYLLEAAFWWML